MRGEKSVLLCSIEGAECSPGAFRRGAAGQAGLARAHEVDQRQDVGGGRVAGQIRCLFGGRQGAEVGQRVGLGQIGAERRPRRAHEGQQIAALGRRQRRRRTRHRIDRAVGRREIGVARVVRGTDAGQGVDAGAAFNQVRVVEVAARDDTAAVAEIDVAAGHQVEPARAGQHLRHFAGRTGTAASLGRDQQIAPGGHGRDVSGSVVLDAVAEIDDVAAGLDDGLLRQRQAGDGTAVADDIAGHSDDAHRRPVGAVQATEHVGRQPGLRALHHAEIGRRQHPGRRGGRHRRRVVVEHAQAAIAAVVQQHRSRGQQFELAAGRRREGKAIVGRQVATQRGGAQRRRRQAVEPDELRPELGRNLVATGHRQALGVARKPQVAADRGQPHRAVGTEGREVAELRVLAAVGAGQVAVVRRIPALIGAAETQRVEGAIAGGDVVDALLGQCRVVARLDRQIAAGRDLDPRIAQREHRVQRRPGTRTRRHIAARGDRAVGAQARQPLLDIEAAALDVAACPHRDVAAATLDERACAGAVLGQGGVAAGRRAERQVGDMASGVDLDVAAAERGHALVEIVRPHPPGRVQRRAVGQGLEHGLAVGIDSAPALAEEPVVGGLRHHVGQRGDGARLGRCRGHRRLGRRIAGIGGDTVVVAVEPVAAQVARADHVATGIDRDRTAGKGERGAGARAGAGAVVDVEGVDRRAVAQRGHGIGPAGGVDRGAIDADLVAAIGIDAVVDRRVVDELVLAREAEERCHVEFHVARGSDVDRAGAGAHHGHRRVGSRHRGIGGQRARGKAEKHIAAGALHRHRCGGAEIGAGHEAQVGRVVAAQTPVRHRQVGAGGAGLDEAIADRAGDVQVALRTQRQRDRLAVETPGIEVPAAVGGVGCEFVHRDAEVAGRAHLDAGLQQRRCGRAGLRQAGSDLTLVAGKAGGLARHQAVQAGVEVARAVGLLRNLAGAVDPGRLDRGRRAVVDARGQARHRHVAAGAGADPRRTQRHRAVAPLVRAADIDAATGQRQAAAAIDARGREAVGAAAADQHPAPLPERPSVAQRRAGAARDQLGLAIEQHPTGTAAGLRLRGQQFDAAALVARGVDATLAGDRDAAVVDRNRHVVSDDAVAAAQGHVALAETELPRLREAGVVQRPVQGSELPGAAGAVGIEAERTLRRRQAVESGQRAAAHGAGQIGPTLAGAVRRLDRQLAGRSAGGRDIERRCRSDANLRRVERDAAARGVGHSVGIGDADASRRDLAADDVQALRGLHRDCARRREDLGAGDDAARLEAELPAQARCRQRRRGGGRNRHRREVHRPGGHESGIGPLAGDELAGGQLQVATGGQIPGRAAGDDLATGPQSGLRIALQREVVAAELDRSRLDAERATLRGRRDAGAGCRDTDEAHGVGAEIRARRGIGAGAHEAGAGQGQRACRVASELDRAVEADRRAVTVEGQRRQVAERRQGRAVEGQSAGRRSRRGTGRQLVAECNARRADAESAAGTHGKRRLHAGLQRGVEFDRGRGHDHGAGRDVQRAGLEGFAAALDSDRLATADPQQGAIAIEAQVLRCPARCSFGAQAGPRRQRQRVAGRDHDLWRRQRMRRVVAERHGAGADRQVRAAGHAVAHRADDQAVGAHRVEHAGDQRHTDTAAFGGRGHDLDLRRREVGAAGAAAGGRGQIHATRQHERAGRLVADLEHHLAAIGRQFGRGQALRRRLGAEVAGGVVVRELRLLAHHGAGRHDEALRTRGDRARARLRPVSGDQHRAVGQGAVGAGRHVARIGRHRDAVAAGQQGVVRRQQGVEAGRQTRSAGKIDARADGGVGIAAVVAIDRRQLAAEGRVDRIDRRLGQRRIVRQHVARAALARREAVGIERAAAGEVEHGRAVGADRAGQRGDLFCRQRAFGDRAASDRVLHDRHRCAIGEHVLPGAGGRHAAVADAAQRHHAAARNRGQAAGAVTQALRDDGVGRRVEVAHLDAAERRQHAPVLDDLRRHRRQATAGREHGLRRVAVGGKCQVPRVGHRAGAAHRQLEIAERGRVELGVGQTQVAQHPERASGCAVEDAEIVRIGQAAEPDVGSSHQVGVAETLQRAVADEVDRRGRDLDAAVADGGHAIHRIGGLGRVGIGDLKGRVAGADLHLGRPQRQGVAGGQGADVGSGAGDTVGAQGRRIEHQRLGRRQHEVGTAEAEGKRILALELDAPEMAAREGAGQQPALPFEPRRVARLRAGQHPVAVAGVGAEAVLLGDQALFGLQAAQDETAGRRLRRHRQHRLAVVGAGAVERHCERAATGTGATGTARQQAAEEQALAGADLDAAAIAGDVVPRADAAAGLEGEVRRTGAIDIEGRAGQGHDIGAGST